MMVEMHKNKISVHFYHHFLLKNFHNQNILIYFAF